jgi:hypothetical protein
MSYNGTVRCGHCYEPGHNRLGCPTRRKSALEQPESYTGRKWHREQEERKLQIASRVCSYCKEANHNRRGCKVFKEDKQLITTRQQEYRREFSLATNSVGFGPGALVKVAKGHFNDDAGVWSKGTVEMVTGINWVHIDFLLKDTDINRDWRTRDRRLAVTRIVSTFGYDKDDDTGWRAPPKHNDTSALHTQHILKILPSVFASTADMTDENSSYGAQLVGPVGFVDSSQAGLDLINGHLEESFNLRPDSRAKDYEKRRVSLAGIQWSMVRKSEHEKAIVEQH